MKNACISAKIACLLFCIFLNTYPGAGPSMAPFPAGPSQGMPMSQQDIEMAQQMEAYMQALPPDKRNELEQGLNYLNSLPPQEQEKYFQQLEKQTEFVLSKLDTMDPKVVEDLIANPAKFEDFVQQSLNEAGPTQQQNFAPQPPAPVETKEDTAEVARQKALQGELKKLVQFIDKLTEIIDAFLVKAEQMHKLPASFKKWLKEQEITSNNASLSWEELKGNIEKLNKTLRAIKSQDPEKKTYKYLTALVTNETLHNNLAHVLKVLQQNEPKFVTPTFGLGKLSKPARGALLKILNLFVECTEQLDLQAALDKIIEEYEPTAAELKKAAQYAEERARSLSEQGIPEVYTDIPYEPYGGSSYAGYDDSGYKGYYPGGDYSYPGTYQEPKAPSTSIKGGKTPSLGGGEAKKPSAPAKAPEKKKEAEEETKRIDTLIAETTESMADIQYAVEDNRYMKDLDKIVLSKDKFGPKDIEIISTLNQIKKQLGAVRSKIRGANIWFGKIKSSKVKDKCRKGFTSALDIPELKTLTAQIDKISQAKGSLTKARLYAYFGEDTFKAEEPKIEQPESSATGEQKKQAPKAKEQESRPDQMVMLNEIPDALKGIKETIKNLGEKKK